MNDSLRPRYDFSLGQLELDMGSRGRVFRAVPSGSRVLDVGCDTGRFGELLRREKGCEVHGVELDPVAAAEAAGRLNHVHVRSVSSQDSFSDLKDFDAVLFLDVLEHLYDPWAVLAGARGVLRPGGAAYAVVPNIAHVSVVRRLIQGRFEYEQHGTMDRTHVRWFTRRSLADALSAAGYLNERVEVVPVVPWFQEIPKIGSNIAQRLASWFPDQFGGSLIGVGYCAGST
jgi:2-polyprenyl-3-methyl-5-hydroxy-6-metoxy-1,4-benzoquinol methylase